MTKNQVGLRAAEKSIITRQAKPLQRSVLVCAIEMLERKPSEERQFICRAFGWVNVFFYSFSFNNTFSEALLTTHRRGPPMWSPHLLRSVQIDVLRYRTGYQQSVLLCLYLELPN